ncbi:hypothetical protein [uncultured Paracoccus sp.]|uniref:hypothetical protein n=1 Tax=uncultured Paracoccus sp. TaxID=189685 RepID=UPI00262FEDE7|nr:hypothetical protein [uncultured Paracoccus sp.]
MNFEKVLLVKFGWSEAYQGREVAGNFDYLQDADGAERYTFAPYDGVYYGYVPPSGIVDTARNDENDGWTVIFVAKEPSKTGLHIVGWYEDATLANGRPAVERDGRKVTYSITAPTAYFVPLEHRTNSFSNVHVGSLKFSFLAGPNKTMEPWKADLLHELEKRIKAVHASAIRNPVKV